MSEMQTINCYIPLKLRLLGEPSENDWAALEERLVALYTRALTRSVTKLTWPHFIAPSLIEDVKESFVPARVGAEGYWIPSYEDNKLTQVPILPEELISKYANDLSLDVDRLGRDLLKYIRKGAFEFIEQVIDTVPWLDRDDVALAITQQATNEELFLMAKSERGRRLLDRLFDELTTGRVREPEMVEANRILQIKASLINIEQQNLQRIKIFPFRPMGISVYDSATFTAERRGQGKIFVKMPSHVRSTQMFKRETQTLPLEVFLSGIELPENEIIGVRLYNRSGELVLSPALYLIQISNENYATFAGNVAGVSIAALSFGLGASAGGIAGFLGRALVWADRAATILGTIATILQEHRYFIIKRFGESGQAFLDAFDKVKSIVQWYGFLRIAIGAVQLFRGLRAAHQDLRITVQDTEKTLSDSERNAMKQISQHSEEMLQNAERIEAEADAAKKLSEAETKTVQTLPKTGGQSSEEARAIKASKAEELASEALKKEKVKVKKPRKVAPEAIVTPESIKVYDSVAGKVDSYRDLREKVKGFGHLFEVDHLVEERFFSPLDLGLDTDDWPAMVVPKNSKVAAQLPGYKGYDHIAKTLKMRKLIPSGYENMFTPQQVLDAHVKVLTELGLDAELVSIEPLFADFNVVFRKNFPAGYFDPPNWPTIGEVRVRKPKP